VPTSSTSAIRVAFRVSRSWNHRFRKGERSSLRVFVWIAESRSPESR